MAFFYEQKKSKGGKKTTLHLFYTRSRFYLKYNFQTLISKFL